MLLQPVGPPVSIEQLLEHTSRKRKKIQNKIVLIQKINLARNYLFILLCTALLLTIQTKSTLDFASRTRLIFKPTCPCTFTIHNPKPGLKTQTNYEYSTSNEISYFLNWSKYVDVLMHICNSIYQIHVLHKALLWQIIIRSFLEEFQYCTTKGWKTTGSFRQLPVLGRTQPWELHLLHLARTGRFLCPNHLLDC